MRITLALLILNIFAQAESFQLRGVVRPTVNIESKKGNLHLKQNFKRTIKIIHNGKTRYVYPNDEFKIPKSELRELNYITIESL